MESFFLKLVKTVIIGITSGLLMKYFNPFIPVFNYMRFILVNVSIISLTFLLIKLDSD